MIKGALMPILKSVMGAGKAIGGVAKGLGGLAKGGSKGGSKGAPVEISSPQIAPSQPIPPTLGDTGGTAPTSGMTSAGITVGKKGKNPLLQDFLRSKMSGGGSPTQIPSLSPIPSAPTSPSLGGEGGGGISPEALVAIIQALTQQGRR